MLRFFYKIRIFFGILLAAAPVTALFCTCREYIFQQYFLYTLLFAIPLWGKLSQHLPCRLLQIITVITTTLSVFQPDARTGGILLGIAAGSILHLTAHSTVFLFSRQNASAHGMFYASVILAAALCCLVSAKSSELYHVYLLCAETAGIFLLPKSLSTQNHTHLPAASVLYRGRFQKPCFFVTAVSASAAICLTLYPLPPVPVPFWFGLLAGAFLMGWFVERKGVFSGCVLLIFLCESPLVFLCLPQTSAVLAAGTLLAASAAGGLPVVLTILTHYLYGPVQYVESFAHLAFCVPLGILLALPFTSLEEASQIPLEEPAICLLFLLVLGFFCIFFAWKQRFVILKNPRM